MVVVLVVVDRVWTTPRTRILSGKGSRAPEQPLARIHWAASEPGLVCLLRYVIS